MTSPRSTTLPPIQAATPELILRRNDGFAKLLARCEGLPPVRCAVVHPCDRDSLLGALEVRGPHLVRNSMLLTDPRCLRVVLPADGGALIPARADGVGYWPMSVTTVPGGASGWMRGTSPLPSSSGASA
mgnify:CR=1 FL=1